MQSAADAAAVFLASHEFAITPGKLPKNQWSVNTANRVRTGGATHLATLPLERLPEQAKILRKDGFHDEAKQMEDYHAGESAKQAAIKAAQPAAPAPQAWTSTVTNTTPVPGYVSPLDSAGRKKALLSFHKHPNAKSILDAHAVNSPGLDKKEAVARLNAAYEAYHVQNSPQQPQAAQAATGSQRPPLTTRLKNGVNLMPPQKTASIARQAAVIDPRVSPHPPEPDMSWTQRGLTPEEKAELTDDPNHAYGYVSPESKKATEHAAAINAGKTVPDAHVKAVLANLVKHGQRDAAAKLNQQIEARAKSQQVAQPAAVATPAAQQPQPQPQKPNWTYHSEPRIQSATPPAASRGLPPRAGNRASMRQLASEGQQDEITPKYGWSSHAPGRFAQLVAAARAGKLKDHLENGLGNFFDKFEHHGNKFLRKIGIPAGDEEFSRRDAAMMEFLLTSEFARHKPDDRQRGFVFDAPAKKGAGWTPPVVERKVRQKSFGWKEEQHPRESAAHDNKRPGEFAKKDSGHESGHEEPAEQEDKPDSAIPDAGPDAKRTKYVAKGNEVFDADGARQAAFRNEEKAKAAAEEWNLNGNPNGKPKPVASRVIPEDLYPSLKDTSKTAPEMTTDQLVDHLNSTLENPVEPVEQVADKTPAEDLATAANDHLSDEITPASLPGMELEKDNETPREAAERQDKALDADYEFARQSSVRNAGEDLKGSARHKRNAWRGLEDAEENGTAAAQVTRDNLLKAEPHDLMSLAESNPLTSIVGYFAIRKFPAKPGFGDERRRSGIDEETNKKDRKQFLETYQEYKAKIESLAKDQRDPLKAIDELFGWVKEKISDLRGVDKDKRQGYMARAGLDGTDKYNNTANSLVDTLKSLQRGYRPKTTSVAGRLAEFSKLAAEAHGEDLDMEALTDHVQDIIEGRSMPDSFGQKGSKGDQYKAADAYVKHAVRKGGRDVRTLTRSPEKSVDSILGKFGARGVQWGNSVTDDERVHHSAKLVEALSDLADITGMKPKDLGLGGKVGWAIGARGHGTALAHYEPWSQVINMTRKSGVGALAHEWGHAFDHSHTDFARKGNDSYLSERKLANRYNSKERKIEKVKSDDPMENAYDELRDAWESSGFNSRISKVLSDLVKEKRMSAKKADHYWNANHEKFARSFERFVQHKLRSDSRDNTYLSGLDDKSINTLWPNDSEIAHMAPAFENLFKIYRKKKYGDEKPQEFSRFEAIEFLSQSDFAYSLSIAINAFTPV